LFDLIAVASTLCLLFGLPALSCAPRAAGSAPGAARKYGQA